MSPLRAAQRALAEALDAPGPGVAWTQMAALIATSPGLAPECGVGVYRDSSRQARLAALEAIHPVCREVLGARCFAALAGAYVGAFPSTRSDLNRYGEAFPRHLEAARQSEPGLSELPYLEDLARLEWHWHAVYYAADDPPFDAPGFAALAADGAAGEAHLHLSAALRLLASNYPVREIWQRHREGGDTAEVTAGDGEHLVIFRHGFSPQVDAVPPSTWALLRAISRGASLTNLAEARLTLEEVPSLIQRRWIVGFSARVCQDPGRVSVHK